MIADDLKALRSSKGLTLRAFARKTGVSFQTLHYIESGRGALSTAEAIALAHRHKISLVYNDGREIRLPGTLGRQLANVRRLLRKKRDDVAGIRLADIVAIETDAPHVTLALVELYARLLSDGDVTLGLQLRPLTKLDKLILELKENAHVITSRQHC